MIGKITEVIKRVVGDKKFIISASAKPELGHYSTNAAFIVGGNPEELAEKIKKAAESASGRIFEKVETKGKFINFWISPKALIRELLEVLKLKKLKNKSSKKINLEFISANPTGPLTMANGRGGFLGDVLANVLETAGHKVTREYIINDAGNQIRLLGESILAALGKAESKEEHYKGAYIKDLAKSTTLKGSAEDIGRVVSKKLLMQIKSSLKDAGIKFDVWFSEYENLHKKGELEKVLGILKKNGLVSEHDGAVWLKRPEGSFARPDSKNESGLGLKTSDIADEKDRVLVKSDGQPTYFLADLAYHYDKFIKRKFDTAIDIWGADHHGYVARLKAGVKALGVEPEKLQVIITQLVRLVEAGKEVRMSKRKGEFITLDELVNEVGKDAARFFFLMHSPDTHMDFDLALAKEKSVKNPVYYVQYAYVRCGSILKKSGVKKVKGNFDLLKSESELHLLRELVKLPDVISQTAEDYQVSRLTRYATELARAVHNFYEKEQVIGEEKEIMQARLALVAATREILGKLFKILGIDTLERM